MSSDGDGPPLSEVDARTEPQQLGDTRVLRGLAHPVRLALIEALTFYGPLTATEAGERIDQSATTCSFHLRQLAKYGLIEEAGGGRGRRRPWRMRTLGFSLSHEPQDLEADVAAQALMAAALSRQVERHGKARRTRTKYPEPWRSMMTQNETVCWVTETEALELIEQLSGLVQRFHERLDPQYRPRDTHPLELVALVHPFEAPGEYQ